MENLKHVLERIEHLSECKKNVFNPRNDVFETNQHKEIFCSVYRLN